jgi:hypothetical protein
MPEWFDYVVEPDFTNVVVDTHQYFMTYPLSPDYKPDATLDDLVAHAREQVASVVREAARHFPVMIGEWSLDTASPHAPTEIGEERRQYYRTIGEAQAQAWEPAVPWTYWAYKHLADTPRLGRLGPR